MPTKLQHMTKLNRKPCMSITLWREHDSSTKEARDAHLQKHLMRFQKVRSGEVNTNAIVAMSDYEVCMALTAISIAGFLDIALLSVMCCLQKWCREVFGIVRPIQSLEMYDAHMSWLADKKAACSSAVEIWHRARKHIAAVAVFHGYMPADFQWKDSEVAKYELSQLVHDNSRAVALDTNGPTVRQNRHSLSQDQLEQLFRYAMTRQAAACALLLAFCGVMGQTLARSGQLLQLNRVHVGYPEANLLPVTPLFGPVQLLHLGDRGHHKVNKDANMAHWVMRTMRPSLACPWFGLALKAALDAKQQQGVQYDELQSRCTGVYCAHRSHTECSCKPGTYIFGDRSTNPGEVGRCEQGHMGG
jgi:hypothetical protein